GKQKTGACSLRVAPVMRLVASAPRARAPRPASSSERSPPTTAARCSKRERVVAKEKERAVRSSAWSASIRAARREARSRRGPGGEGGGAAQRRLAALSLSGLRIDPCLRDRPLLQDQVGVGAADAEGRDTRPARTAVWLPLGGIGQELDLPRLPVDLGGGSV